MMSPAIGPIEVLIVAVAAVAAVILGGFGSWSLVIIAVFASAMLLTPADPLSLLLLAVPALVVIKFLSTRKNRRNERE